MSSLPRRFANDLCYHVYNCGVERRITFITEKDYQRFLGTISYYLYNQQIPYSEYLKLNVGDQKEYLSSKKSAEFIRIHILAYCLMPNHFHLLVKQAKDSAVSAFMSDISNSYTKYFNTKNQRLGNLFRGPFSAKEILTQESFLQVSRYIHLNPVMSSKVKWKDKPELYPYSSYSNWIKGDSGGIINMEEINKFVELNPRDYKLFVASKLPENFYNLNFSDLLLEGSV